MYIRLVAVMVVIRLVKGQGLVSVSTTDKIRRATCSHEDDPTFPGGCSNGNDGDPQGSGPEDCYKSISDSQDFRWWRVDIGEFQKITKLALVTGRGVDDAYATKGLEFRAATTIEDATKAIQENFEVSCATFKDPINGQYKSHEFTCETPVAARYVTIVQRFLPLRLNGVDVPRGTRPLAHPLSFCELKIWGENPSDQDVGRPGVTCTQNSDCLANTECQDGICKIKPGKFCIIQANGRQFCHKDTLCDAGVCRLKAGELCNLNRGNLCISTAICEPSTETPKTCKLTTETPCNTTGQCVRNAVCSKGQCGFTHGRACEVDKDCVSGAKCLALVCTCIEDASNLLSNNTCDPKPGRAAGACVAGACTDPDTSCVDDICACTSPKILTQRDYTCRLPANSACADDIDCATGSVCQESKCKLLANEVCANDNECLRTLVCDNGECKTAVGERCRASKNLCRKGTECQGDLCKLRLGEGPCVNITHCVEGSACHTTIDHKCYLLNGMDCTGDNTELCFKDLAVCASDGKCRSSFNSGCAGTVNWCLQGLECSSNQCKRSFGQPCNTSDDCATAYKCDTSKHCRVQHDGACQGDSACVQGANCEDGKCKCNTAISTVSSGLCTPQAGLPTGACNSGACTDAKATCNTTTSTCVCSEGYEVDQANYNCKVAAGHSCTDAVDCSSSSICDSDGFCRLKPGSACVIKVGDNLCSGVSICEDGICQSRFGGDCRTANYSCLGSTTCDRTRKCRYRVGAPCTPSLEGSGGCVAGGQCVRTAGDHATATCACSSLSTASPNGLHCLPKEQLVMGACDSAKACTDSNAECTDSVCRCKDGFGVDIYSWSCKSGPGKSCSGKGSCVSGSVCVGDICKVSLGSDCSGALSGLCASGTVCDSSQTCRLEYGRSCASAGINSNVACRIGALCDSLLQCKIPQGFSCKGTAGDVCTAGATCTNNVCACNAAIGSTAGVACTAKRGKATGECSSGSCDDPNANCVSGLCECKEGASVNPLTFTCRQGATKAELDVASSLVPILLGSLIGSLVLVTACVIIGKRKMRKEQTDIVAQVRKQSIAVARLSQHVQQLSVEGQSTAGGESSVGGEESSGGAEESSNVESTVD